VPSKGGHKNVGHANGAWQGGTTKNVTGYIRIKAGPQRDKYVHKIVAEAMLRRELRDDETVDHIDGNKLNNHWENLQVLTLSTHAVLEAKRRKNARADKCESKGKRVKP